MQDRLRALQDGGVVVDEQRPTAAVGRVLEQSAQPVEERSRVDRLQEVVARSQCASLLAVLHDRDHDDRDVAGLLIRLEPAQHLPAVEVGEHHVKRDGERLQPLRHLDRLGGVACDLHAVAGVCQVVDEQARGHRVVFDHEHRRAAGGGNAWRLGVIQLPQCHIGRG